MADSFSEALAHHQVGNLARAEEMYRAVLRETPDHADALHLLGVIAHQCGAEQSAVDLIRRAIAVRRCADWYLESIQLLDGGRADRVINKMADNYTILGWLAILFPSARFIHCRRDPRDIALSCWMTSFANIRWAYGFDHIVQRIHDYHRVMDHWRSVLPVPLVEVQYERMVADLEGESRRLVAAVGLEWDPACLEFHRTKRFVRSASVTHVRQPLYSRAVGRWRHYSDVLRPWLEELTPDR